MVHTPPENYADWKECITEYCGIPLTPDYVEKRLKALRDPTDYSTKRFIEIYGEPYLARIIGWFEQADRELR